MLCVFIVASMQAYNIHVHVHVHVECRGFESYMYLRQLIFLRKNDCRRCAVLLCLVVCLTLLDSFFLPSHLSLKICTPVYTCTCTRVHACTYMYMFLNER